MNARKFFSNIGIAFFVMFAVYLGVQTAVCIIIDLFAPQLIDISLVYYTAALAPLYAVGVPVCARLLKRVPKVRLYKNGGSASDWFKTFFICVFVMYAGNIIGQLVNLLLNTAAGLESGSDAIYAMESGDLLSVLIFSVILAPIFEELVFRKLLIDRVIVFGDKTAIVLSALMFALFHGNVQQFFYAFGLGIILSYVYIRTGRLRRCVFLHMAVNLFCGLAPAYFLTYAESIYAVFFSVGETAVFQFVSTNLLPVLLMIFYVLLTIAFIILGVLFMIRARRSIELRAGEYSMSFFKTAGYVLSNLGMWLFFAVCALAFALSMI